MYRFKYLPRQRQLVIAFCLLVGPLSPAAAVTSASAQEQEITDLRHEIEQMRADYEKRIGTLEARLATLEANRKKEATAAKAKAADDELEALRAAARREAGSAAERGGVGETAPAVASSASVGHERNLNRLNPEISFTGDVVGVARGASKTFDAREFELDIQATLDPFSSTRWTVSFADGEVDVEEGYVSYTGLARGLKLRGGKIRQTFGVLNRFHQHALPQVDYPLALRTFFTPEGLAQTGISAEWLIPHPWASANELTVQLTDGESAPFGGGSLKRLAVLTHLKNYWDLSPSTYLEWGISGIGGRETIERDTRIWGSDLTVHWQPPSKAKYREFTWRTELLLSQREDALDDDHDAWGGYSYVEGLARRNLYLGLAYDWVEDPFDSSAKRWILSPYLTWWQSEFVRLRGMYQLVRNAAANDTDHRVVLQLTWAAGPHKHESY